MDKSLKKSLSVKILLLSILILFLELFLIRWLSCEIRIFSYFRNLVLLGCFVGLGMGALIKNKPPTMLWSIAGVLILIIAGGSQHFISITQLLSPFSGEQFIWQVLGEGIHWVHLFKGLVLTFFLFLTIIAIFLPIGALLAEMLQTYPRITIAYSVNIVGSLIGVWLFTLSSYLYFSPYFWMIIVAALFWFFIGDNIREKSLLIIFSIISIFLLLPYHGDNSNYVDEVWSPYQKLEVNKLDHGQFWVSVNNARFMMLVNNSVEFFQKYIGKKWQKDRMFNQYDFPYLFKNNLKDVLIVGSGGGNGVAAALRNGALSVDAVEIDPVIYGIGLRYHPERPYQHKHVNIIINDARAFFKSSTKKYDVVSFGLLDSHINSSSLGNTRLDEYVYTEESIREARRLLKQNGVLTLVFKSQKEWITWRIYHILNKVFPNPPLVINVFNRGGWGWNATMFVAHNDAYNLEAWLSKNGKLREFIKRNALQVRPIEDVSEVKDDWPYFYLKKRSIPQLYIILSFCLLIMILPLWNSFGIQRTGINWHFFFLGAGFMLLEFQNISKSSLLFGSTWITNVYTFSAILILILLSNWLMDKFQFKQINFAYWLLLCWIVFLFVLPVNMFLIMGTKFNIFITATLMNIPILFAGLIFIHSFNQISDKKLAYGSNLLGACVGGLCESLSFLMGIRFLLVILLIFYGLSWYLCSKRTSITFLK